MQLKNAAILAVRLLALYLLVQGVIILPAYLKMAFIPSGDSSAQAMTSMIAFSVLAGGIMQFIIAGLLWFFAHPLADIMTKELPDTSTQTEEQSLPDVQAVAISILGLYIVAHATPSFTKGIISLVYSEHRSPFTLFDAIGAIVQMGVGLLFAAVPWKIMNLFRRQQS
jgi:hypothetical protein